ncbi:MAG: hypothetical protein N2327_03865 [Caldimicrobium sp.]|nr:hypothetical protein [Caldimicrobium sp.]MCX7873554.1 hypothetical protein [Caldimicrobium sp.]MDW8094061.1 hypothetical protein [Caldimicrobium sp.]
MVRRELLELKRVLEEERSALIKGAADEILKWSAYKVRLLHLLQQGDLSSEELEILKELREKNEQNRKIIEAGLSFIEEAYRMLNSFFINRETYNNEKTFSEGRLIVRSA